MQALPSTPTLTDRQRPSSLQPRDDAQLSGVAKHRLSVKWQRPRSSQSSDLAQWSELVGRHPLAGTKPQAPSVRQRSERAQSPSLAILHPWKTRSPRFSA